MTRPLENIQIAGARIWDAARRSRGAVRHWRAYGDTVFALRRLSARERADIGLEAAVEDFAADIADHRPLP